MTNTNVCKPRVRLSTNTPFATPTWQDITAFVSIEDGIKLKRGRPDVLTEVDSGDCTFTLSNLDGRFTSTNASGPYYPNLRKNNRIEIAVSADGGVNYDVRGIFYVNGWPNTWEGKDAKAEIACSDIFKIMEKQGNSRGNYIEEVLQEVPQALYALDELDPSTSFGNTNVNSAVTVASFPLRPLELRVLELPASTEGARILEGTIDLNDSNGAPDAAGGVKFAPVSLHGGAKLLHGNLPAALPTDWVVEFWMHSDGLSGFAGVDSTQQDYQAILTFNGPPNSPLASQMAIGIFTGPTWTGNVGIFQSDGNGATGGVFTENWTVATAANSKLSDGKLHMVTVEYTSATHSSNIYVDGISVKTSTANTWPTSMSFMTVGGMDSRLYATYINGKIRNFNGTVSCISIFNRLSAGYQAPSVRYLAGQGWSGELSGARIVRLLQYVGLTSSQYTIGTGTQLLGQQFTRDQSLLQAAQDAAAVEDMPLFVDQNGLVHFDDRAMRNPGTFTTIDAVEFDQIGFSDDDAFVINVVDVDGTQVGRQTFANLDGGTSVTNNGEYRKTISGLPLYQDNQGCDLARRLLTHFANPIPRINALVLNNAAVLGTTPYLNVRNLEVNQGISITNLPTYFPNSNLGTPYKVYIEMVEEAITWNVHQFTFNCTGLTSFDANESNNGDRNVWQLGVTGHNTLGTQTIVDF